mmetsp:Transcript_28397/g.68216  ORF Transcript_28397/g.68216 Transcript_28397/m.68216 type:complete len:332 (-) Transcript_28397:246-1241(-)
MGRPMGTSRWVLGSLTVAAASRGSWSDSTAVWPASVSSTRARESRSTPRALAHAAASASPPSTIFGAEIIKLLPLLLLVAIHFFAASQVVVAVSKTCRKCNVQGIFFAVMSFVSSVDSVIDTPKPFIPWIPPYSPAIPAIKYACAPCSGGCHTVTSLYRSAPVLKAQSQFRPWSSLPPWVLPPHRANWLHPMLSTQVFRAMSASQAATRAAARAAGGRAAGAAAVMAGWSPLCSRRSWMMVQMMSPTGGPLKLERPTPRLSSRPNSGTPASLLAWSTPASSSLIWSSKCGTISVSHMWSSTACTITSSSLLSSLPVTASHTAAACLWRMVA